MEVAQEKEKKKKNKLFMRTQYFNYFKIFILSLSGDYKLMRQHVLNLFRARFL